MSDSLGFFARSDLGVVQFPDWETLPYDVFSPYQDIISRRLATLAALPRLRQGIIVLPVATLMQRIAPAEYVRSNSLLLATGQKLNPDEFRARLVASGYRVVGQVSEHGDVAVRGALIDVFPMGTDLPLRIDLFDEEIETLRRFDPDTQLSLDQIETLDILPGQGIPAG